MSDRVLKFLGESTTHEQFYSWPGLHKTILRDIEASLDELREHL